MPDSNQLADEKVVDLLKALGRAYLENGENLKAADKFRQLVDQNFEDPEILLHYALALARAESTTEEALKIYSKAVEAEHNDEALYLTLSTLFLKKNVKIDPALTVFRRSLNFSPPFEDEIRSALERIFQETTETITVPEIRQTLLDSMDNPELLSLFLTIAWRDKKFDETLQVLKDLYRRSKQNPIYLKAICDTLLESKASAEEIGQYFTLSIHDAQYCLKYKNIDTPITRINEIELFLDLKNLFLFLKKDSNNSAPKQDEYELFILDKAIDNIEEITESINIPIDIEPKFDFPKDLIAKIRDMPNNVAARDELVRNLNGPNTLFPNPQLQSQLNTIAIFEIKNFHADPEISKLPFQTFIKLISGELAKFAHLSLSTTEDGIIAFSAEPRKIMEQALEILDKLERYNQVVDESEIIELRITLHCSPIPFIGLEDNGIKELRKAFKVHNLVLTNGGKNEGAEKNFQTESNLVLVTEQVSNQVDGVKLNMLGEYSLSHFPGRHIIYEAFYKEPNTTIRSHPSKKHFGKYQVIETLKENELYSTFRGYDPQLERTVVIKAYKIQAFSAYKELMYLRKQFYEEVRKLNRINHPNIEMIYDAGENDNILYLVREFIEGKSLNDHFMEKESTYVENILQLYIHICRVLSHYHQSQIWHKNLKPDNIFIMQQGEIKIVDSGILQVRHPEKMWNDDINSYAYAAPEQIQGTRLTHSCDNFQLATMLYESLTGSHPFKAKSASDTRVKIMAEDLPPVSTLRTDLPQRLDTILAKSLEKHPEKRYSSIKDLEKDLKKLLDNQESTTERRMFELFK